MEDSPKGPATRAGLTPGRVVDGAVALSRDRGLHTWSQRDLAKALGVSTSAIYHHVGDKEELCRRVVERVVAELDHPDPRLGWKDWFRALLFPARARMAAVPGSAMWVLMHGPTFASLVPIMDDGVTVLRRAGLGEQVGMAYAAVVNCALLTIAAGDERLVKADDGARDRSRIAGGLKEVGAGSGGASELGAVAASFTEDAAVDHYYRYVIETMLDGLSAQISR
ncbi:TetR/AcrR family transcriptional regulator [Glycomyces sp. NPDC047010]|uniref:TetR/AcrR family transcriptional regulator n=1 Tax=Glycomyces sp. NPDC047010 TaxID=3155023 RepID=UPI0033D3A9EE